MNDTHFFLPENKVGRLATVYSSVDGGSQVRARAGLGHHAESGTLRERSPQGLLRGRRIGLSTAMDYATFLQMMLNGGEFNGTRILSRKTVESMVSDHLGDIAVPARPGLRPRLLGHA